MCEEEGGCGERGKKIIVVVTVPPTAPQPLSFPDWKPQGCLEIPRKGPEAHYKFREYDVFTQRTKSRFKRVRQSIPMPKDEQPRGPSLQMGFFSLKLSQLSYSGSCIRATPAEQSTSLEGSVVEREDAPLSALSSVSRKQS